MDNNEMITLLSQILDERIGMVTAYAYAKSKGYSGSADDFANDMANIGVNISAIETAINTFNNQTVPNAETAITTAGSNQVTAVNTAGQEQLQNVTAEGGRQVGLVAAAGSAQTEAVNAAGASQVENVNTAGTTQVTNINNAGATQITAIQTKGEQTRASIPSDYTTLSNEVTGLKTAFSYGKNLVDPSTFKSYTWIDNTTGEEKPDGVNDIVTGFIPVKRVYYGILGGYRAWLYDENKNFLETVAFSLEGRLLNIVAAHYIRIGTNRAHMESLTMVEGETIPVATPYIEPYLSQKYRLPLAYNAPLGTVKTVAHRGDDILAPQNTAPSYIIARKNGHTVAENDLWLSEDNQFVMWHDTTLSRLGTNLFDINGYYMYTDGTNYYWYDSDNAALYTYDSANGYVPSSVDVSTLTQCKGADYGVNSEYATHGLNLDVLKRIDFGAYKGEQFKGTQILTFEEWVLLCKQLGMDMYVDKKLTYTDALITEAANIVKKYGMSEHVSWLGLSPSQITVLRSIIEGARCGILSHPSDADIATYSQYNTGKGFFFNGDAKNGMTAEAIQKGLSAGFDVEVYYVDLNLTESEQFETIRQAVSYGVTGMSLDHYRVSDAYDYLLDQF